MDEAHLIAAVRNVSLNPVRVRLVARAEDWAWSSARAHLARRDDELAVVAPMLKRFDAAGLEALIKPSTEDEAALAALRAAETTGRPLGNAGFIEGLERLLGRPVARRAPARKPAQVHGVQPNLL